MSLEFVDGFDHYQMPLQKWDSFVGNGNGNFQLPLILPNIGRNGGGGLLIAGHSLVPGALNTVPTMQAIVQKNLPNVATRIVGYAVNLDKGTGTGNLNVDQVLLKFLDGATIQVDLRVTPAGHFYFTRNGTVLGSVSTNPITFNAWHYIEVKVTINSSTGVCVLNMDGIQLINLTAQNTQATGSAQTNAILVGNHGTSFDPIWKVIVDDLYVCNTSGSFNNAFLGDIKVQGVMPSGNGTTLNYTKNEVAWVANQQVFVGRQIKDSNGNIQIVTSVTGDAKTGGSAPTWAIVAGNTTVDNHATWTMILAATDYLEVNQNPIEGLGQRKNSYPYTVGMSVWDNNGNVQMCTTGGSTNNADISQLGGFSLVLGGTVGDGSVVWTNIGLFEDLYLSNASIGDISRFTYPSITMSTVQAVVATMRARKDDASVRSIRGATKSGGTTGDSGTDLPLSTSYQTVQGIFETDPNTGVAWTGSGANAAEFGIKTTA